MLIQSAMSHVRFHINSRAYNNILFILEKEIQLSAFHK